MTPTQIARRSDALYADGTRGMTRRVLCDMVAQRESDIEDARAENAKLRELVARLIRHIENPPCEGCMAEMSCPGGEGLTNCDEYQFMVCDARKLGVEVD